MKAELLKEMYTSVDRVNELHRNEEITPHARNILIQEEYTKQAKLKVFLDEWNQT